MLILAAQVGIVAALMEHLTPDMLPVAVLGRVAVAVAVAAAPIAISIATTVVLHGLDRFMRGVTGPSDRHRRRFGDGYQADTGRDRQNDLV